MVLKRKLPSKQGLTDKQENKGTSGTDFVADDFPESPNKQTKTPDVAAESSAFAEDMIASEPKDLPEKDFTESEDVFDDVTAAVPEDDFADFDASDFTEARSVDSPHELTAAQEGAAKDFVNPDSDYDPAQEPEFNKVQYHTESDEESQIGQPTASLDAGDDWDLDPASFMSEEVKKEEITPEDSKPEKAGQPWQAPHAGSAPEIPQSQPAAASKSNPFAALMSLLFIVGLFGGSYYVFENKEKFTEIFARWTGALNEVSAELPAQELAIDSAAGYPNAQDDLTPDEVVVMPSAEKTDIQIKDRQPAMGGGDGSGTGTPAAVEQGQVIATTEDDILDQDKTADVDIMPADEAEKAKAEEMPKEVSAFAALQAAIMKKREQKNEKNEISEFDELMNEPVNMKELGKLERRERVLDMRQQLNKELRAYRQTLTKYDDASLMPKPGEFFSGEYSDQLRRTRQQENGLDPEYADESIIPKLQAPETPGVRTLNAFEEYMSEPERQKIRMPKNLDPWVAGNLFPPLELLSIVPNYGIIALLGSEEGVLLLGDEVKGWELVSAEQTYAEFRKGKHKKVLSLEHANR